MNMEERIEQYLVTAGLVYSGIPGTIISRVMDCDAPPGESSMWSIGIGQLNAPKSFYTGKTIEEALSKIEKDIGESK